MKIFKVIAPVLVTVFLFSAVGFCDTPCPTDDDTQHCDSCCSSCYTAVLSSSQNSIASSLSAPFIQFDAVLRQEPFLSGIEYPPKALSKRQK